MDAPPEWEKLSSEAFLLAQQGRLGDAALQFERALELALRSHPDEASAPVIAARYFLGEHYLRMGEADSARRVVAPSLSGAEVPLGWIVEAEALFLSGSVEAARPAGERAVALALSDEQRERIRERLAPLWEER